MKKIFLLISIFGLLFVSCERDEEVNIRSLEVLVEKLTPSYTSVYVEVDLAFSGTYDSYQFAGAYVQYATSQDFVDYQSVAMQWSWDNSCYKVCMEDLTPNTTYYVRYYADTYYSSATTQKISEFKTLQPSVPTVIISNVSNVSHHSAMIHGEVTSDGGSIVSERGVVYSTSQNPTTADIKVTSGSGTGSFSCNLTGLQEKTTYYVRAYAVNSKGTAYGEQISFKATKGMENGYDWVDLGLSVKWATMNVGATKPEDYGGYFAWGETQPKSTYNWSTYKWCNGSYDTQTKYCTNSSYGTVDNKTQLELSDDAARANWGGSWRMPTHEEQEELRTQCTWTWTTQNGVYGYKVTSKKSGYTYNSIFLPAAGYRYGSSRSFAGSDGRYWSSSLSTASQIYAYHLSFLSDFVTWNGYYRYYGLSVRPVCQ